MNKRVKCIVICGLLLISIIFTGCTKIDNLKVKLGMKNTDFEYIKEGKIKQITIENIRDKSYTFIVKDENSIMQIYEILSQAETVEEKISLTPDYIIRLEDKSSHVNEYSYVAGIDKIKTGNFFNEDQAYIVSKRLDNDIIKYFWNIRRPNDFNDVYYGNIQRAIEKYYNNYNKDTLGINLFNDKEVMKFILTLDLEEFKLELPDNIEIVENNNYDKYNTTMSLTTTGYKSEIFKCIIKFESKEPKNLKVYYIINKYDKSAEEWDYHIYEDDEPEGF